MTVETQTSQGIKVPVTRQNAESGQVSFLSPASAEIKDFTFVTIGFKETQPTVNVSMAYTFTDELEMWWCDNWRVLWNNGIKSIWRK